MHLFYVIPLETQRSGRSYLPLLWISKTNLEHIELVQDTQLARGRTWTQIHDRLQHATTTVRCFPVLRKLARPLFFPEPLGRFFSLGRASPCFSALLFPILQPSLLQPASFLSQRGSGCGGGSRHRQYSHLAAFCNHIIHPSPSGSLTS